LESRGRRRLVWGKCVDTVGGSRWGVPVDGVVACIVAEEGEDGVEDKGEDEAVLVREEGGGWGWRGGQHEVCLVVFRGARRWLRRSTE